MSKMAELFAQIEELLENDYTGSEIADMLNIDIDIVYDVMESFFTPKKEIGFDFDLGRMQERVEGVFIQLPESVQSDDDFISWVSAQ